MSKVALVHAGFTASLAAGLQALRDWPWFDTARTLRERFREDRLGLTAGSLTFTTLISLVPLVTVMLAIFTAFPMFSAFQGGLEKYFLQTLVPPGIARPVLGALTLFAAKASRLGAFGLIALGLTAMALMLTIDRTLNAIWRVRKPRPIAQRVLVYWAAMTLGPLMLGASLTLTSYAISSSSGLVQQLPGGVKFAIEVAEFAVLAVATGALFYYVPHAPVAWRHALAGGFFVASGLEITRHALGWYLKAVPTYSNIYGAFATVPIFLLWIYLCWVMLLLGALVAAYAPSLHMRMVRHGMQAGQAFALALEVVHRLSNARDMGGRGLGVPELANTLRIDPLLVEAALQSLTALDWVGRLEEGGHARHVLLCDPMRTPLAPLVDALLLAPVDALAAVRARMQVERLVLGDVLPA